MRSGNMAKAFTKGQEVTLISNWDGKGTFSYTHAIVYSCGQKQMILTDAMNNKELGRNFKPVMGEFYYTGAVFPRMSDERAIAVACEAASNFLKEEEIDISHKQTRAVVDCVKSGTLYDYVITVCDETSAERCPVFPGSSKRLHWGFTDPSKFEGTLEHKLTKTRTVREEIRQRIEGWLKTQL